MSQLNGILVKLTLYDIDINKKLGNNMSSKNTRLHWVDIAKGLLIIMVVVHHLPYVAQLYDHSSKIDCMGAVNCLFVSYFMAAFFILTGFCSSFDRKTKDFLLRNVKTILLPGALFTILLHWFFLLVARDFTLSHWLDTDVLKKILLYGSEWWFLSSLFCAKLIYYVLHKLIRIPWVIGLVTLMFMVLGIWLYSQDYTDYWFYQHTLAFCPFIAFGYWLKSHQAILTNNLLAFGCGGVVVVLSILAYAGTGLPDIHMTFNMVHSVPLVPLALVYAVFGSLLVFRISQIINKSRALEYVGRNTLVIYMFHADIESVFLSHVLIFDTTALNVIAACFTAIVTLAIALLASKIINTKYLHWMLGKF